MVVSDSMPSTGGPVARFRYESDTDQSWVPALSNSLVTGGSLAVQNAGSTSGSLYYQIGGGGLNGAVAHQLGSQLAVANDALKVAYDRRFGSGAYDHDAASQRQDRCTSLLVPAASGCDGVGTNVDAIVYSVGPQLPNGVIEDEEAYRQIYADAFQTLSDCNAAGGRSTIEAFRITLLSTGIYGGGGGPHLKAQAAKLIVDAACNAIRSRPELHDLVILINTNDGSADPDVGHERLAFDAAAANLKIMTMAEGFNVHLRPDKQ